jgi:uncharacterized OsmC-like protein
MDLIRVNLQHDMVFSGEAGGFQIRMDMPDHPRFTDSGPSPADLFVMAIGGCIGMHVAAFCEKAGLPPGGIRVDLAYTLAEEEGRRRVASVYAEVLAPGIPPHLKATAEEAARQSILPETLSRPPELDIAMWTGGALREAA